MFELSRVVPRIELNIEAGRDAALNVLNAANDAVEQALSKTSLAELVRDVG